MANDLKPLEDLNGRAKLAVEQTKERVLAGNFLRKTILFYPSGGTDVGEKLKSYAEKNVAATHQFVHKLSQAEDFAEIVRLQTEFTQAQMSAFVEQINGLGSAYTKALAAAVKPPSS